VIASPRYAIYYAPAPGSRWWRFGCEWLGRDAISGRALEPMRLADLARAEIVAATATPRRYGFHATLKAPFALTAECNVNDLDRALRAFAAAQTPTRLGQLRLLDLDGFLALRPIEKAALRQFAADCVEHFDFLRAPASAAELARRRAATLTLRQQEMLARWGYPYVMDEYRFHLTLTERLDEVQRERMRAALQPLVQALNAEPLQVDALCLFEQRAGAPFMLTHRYGFDGSVTRYRAAAAADRGRLFYVVGPSGAGKDSLLRYVRDRLGATHPIAFAHRYITRAAEAGGENHVALDAAEFQRRERAGAFAMSWDSHGQRYGIGVEIDHWLERGLDVVVNGSRAYLDQATARYPDLTVIWITAPAPVLHTRLHARGREAAEAVALRLARAEEFVAPPGSNVIEIVNDAALDRAGEQLMQALRSA
jgi:ribose 1,5-bisphosphokinase